MSSQPRFSIGIDLGTTNSACAFVDHRRHDPRPELFEIPQLTESFVVKPQAVLPSFLYFGDEREVESGALALPWDQKPASVVGLFARERGALSPGRQVSSAKSWLAHPGVDRRAAILPFGAGDLTEDAPRISPVDASAQYLSHMREAWNVTQAAGDAAWRFEQQHIVLTVPASFDEEARELTVEAAHKARLTSLTLLEEPIAAFYAWLAGAETGTAGDLLADEQIALVCDVGGGTTDFSLIRVRINADGPAFERIAIGDHLLLGGDNVDVALTALLERRLIEAKQSLRLAITQRAALRRLCSAAKERLLGPEAPPHVPVTILGSGRSVIGEAVTAEMTRDDVERSLAEFLPETDAEDFASPRDRRGGLRELGLPYEADPAITRHLASFLARSAAALPADHRALRVPANRPLVRPDLVLFNGGFFTPAAARDRMSRALERWFGSAPTILPTTQLESAVALGAATYGQLRAGVRRVVESSGDRRSAAIPNRRLRVVKAGSGRAYYVGLRAPNEGGIAAVCVLARGTEEGTQTRIPHPFTIAANRPISFPLFSSTTRSDAAGSLVTLAPGEDIAEHAPLVTVLRYGRKSRQVELPVHLAAAFTEVGTLELWCESQVSEHRWRVQFQLRGAEQSETDAPGAADATTTGDAVEGAEAVVNEEAIEACTRVLADLFGQRSVEVPVDQVVAHLERVSGFAKNAWPLAMIRRFADTLMEVAEGRRASPQLEARWLNLFGFCLRPGFGAAKDPWRVAESRRIYSSGLLFGTAIQNRVEWLVLWQRVAGGFSSGQQRELGLRVMGELGLSGKKAARFNPQIERESWRLLGSLERLDAPLRITIGNELLRRIRRDPGNASLLWSIGRLGARTPLYGPLSSIVPPEEAVRWVEALFTIKKATPELAEALVQIGALTGDPLRDLDPALVARMRQWLDASAIVDEQWTRPLREIVGAAAGDVSRVFGEPLPHGLRLDVAEARPS
jgi:hypothetical protein